MKKIALLLACLLALTIALTGCERSSNKDTNVATGSGNSSQTNNTGSGNATDTPAKASELHVNFGNSDIYVLHLENNDTAAAIARYVGTADWNLPIYHYDDFDEWENMQYYDIPSRYDIPSAPVSVTQAKAGEVYYSEPNRIILFYHDAEISAEYTKVGYIDYSDKFAQDVVNNPVVAGLSNKIVSISPAD